MGISLMRTMAHDAMHAQRSAGYAQPWDYTTLIKQHHLSDLISVLIQVAMTAARGGSSAQSARRGRLIKYHQILTTSSGRLLNQLFSLV